ncbi:MAG: hypothetical protein ACI30I_12080, partial [Parabacteroides sp.]
MAWHLASPVCRSFIPLGLHGFHHAEVFLFEVLYRSIKRFDMKRMICVLGLAWASLSVAAQQSFPT